MDVNAPNPPTSEEPKPPAPTIPPDPNQPEQQNFFQRSWSRFQNWVQANPRQAAIYGGALLLLILSFFIRAPQPHVALSGEPLMPGGWFTNTLLTVAIVDVILIVVALLVGLRMQLVPGGLQNLVEALLEYLYNLAESVAGRRAATFFPWAATIFLFVLLSNYTGLIPGVGSIGFFHEEETHAVQLGGQLAMADGKLLLAEEGEEHHAKFVPLFRAPSADLNVTFALALATMVMVQVHGIRTLGGGYFRKFWNPSGSGFMKGINIFVGILEAISELARVLTFSFRLFGNIFAGEVVLATMAFLITFLVPVPFYALELLVGAVQALVFAMLALVFFTMATISHGHDEHHDEQHIEHFAEEQVLRP
ncbi:MAG: ATP synthase F0 subunit A [Chloroflexi bacterium]|nr:MAG: ATP synthase F0 subunit A [Chloroflexota bacterium]